MAFKITDFNPKMQRAIQDQLARQNFGAGRKDQTGNDNAGRLAPAREIPAAPSKTKRIRQSSKPLMNSLEAEYYGMLCNLFGENLVKPQAIRLRLANGCWYKGDFVVFFNWTDDKIIKPIRIYEVKGEHAFRGGFEYLKIAAGQYPLIQFILVWKEKQTKQWREQVVLP